MINFKLTGSYTEVLAGIQALSEDLGISLGQSGTELCIAQDDGCDIRVTFDGKSAKITYNKKHHFFRALGLLVEAVKDGKKDIDIEEKCHFTMNGPMFDVSQGSAVIAKDEVKKTIRTLAVMGLNMLMLYCEDSFDVKAQPYFGYMRGRYTKEEMREMDDYADMFGIEMIPCIQTLAHLIDVLKWAEFNDIKEDDECLFVGEEKTYKFIEDLIREASEPFRTKKIHIGMDEAFRLGRGSYLTKHGYVSGTEIMKIHLEKVLAIVKKYGLEPMIWSDMFFVQFGDHTYFQPDEKVPQSVIDSVPDGIRLVYWDYYHHDTHTYENMLLNHRAFGSEPIFAGGIWTWIGYGPHWEQTFDTTDKALSVCKKLGVREVIATVWGDNGTECPYHMNLLGIQLFAEEAYCDEMDFEKLKKRFEFCTGAKYDDFYLLEDFDRVPTLPEKNYGSQNPSKYLMWQDIMTGLLDRNIDGIALDEHYRTLAEKLRPAMTRNGDCNDLFDMYYNLANSLAMKAEMGLRITRAYKAGDKAALKNFAAVELPELRRRVAALRASHMKLWFKRYKAFGWDIFDMRYGSVLTRIDSAAEEINMYLEGKLERLEELEEERLNYNSHEGLYEYANYYGRIVSPSRIAPYC